MPRDEMTQTIKSIAESINHRYQTGDHDTIEQSLEKIATCLEYLVYEIMDNEKDK